MKGSSRVVDRRVNDYSSSSVIRGFQFYVYTFSELKFLNGCREVGDSIACARTRVTSSFHDRNLRRVAWCRDLITVLLLFVFKRPGS